MHVMNYDDLHCIWWSRFGLRRQKQMAVATIHADTINKLLTATSTNQVSSSPSNVLVSWPEARNKNNHQFIGMFLLIWKRYSLRHNVFATSSDPSPQWFTLSHTRSGWIHSSFVMHRNSLQACSAQKWITENNWREEKTLESNS